MVSYFMGQDLVYNVNFKLVAQGLCSKIAYIIHILKCHSELKSGCKNVIIGLLCLCCSNF